jgi:hypothetical protein
MRTAARARQDVFKDRRDTGCCKQLLQLQQLLQRERGRTSLRTNETQALQDVFFQDKQGAT